MRITFHHPNIKVLWVSTGDLTPKCTNNYIDFSIVMAYFLPKKKKKSKYKFGISSLSGLGVKIAC